MAKEKQKIKRNSFTKTLLVVSSIIAGSILTLFVFEKLSKGNKFLCEFLGKVWLSGTKREATYPARGCFTWEQFYLMEMDSQ
ncbi:MAG: hypothetical protein PVJ52_03250 [Candidatus Woesebacteria bacterium]|jgi:hypothetical protein